MKRWTNLRDIGLFLGGVAGVFHETVLSHGERPTLLILFAAMMGLPAFLRPQEAAQSPQLPLPAPTPVAVEQSSEATIPGETSPLVKP